MMTLQDFDDYLSPPHLPLREVMSRINATRHLFQLIVDADGVLLGTVTDGDIRRALLRGVTLDEPARECMQADFVAQRQRNAAALNTSTKRAVTFLPLLDGRGRLVDVAVPDTEGTGIVHALVMAGGFGKRLGHRTSATPKPLLSVGGRPILDHVLESLEDAGVERVHISVYHLADQIRSFIDGRSNRSHVTLVEEKKPLGTAGALGLLDGDLSGPVLVINGDVLSRVDLGAMHEFHHRHGLDGTISVARHDLEVPFGVIRYDDAGLFESIEEKPSVSNFVAAGIYYLAPEFAALVPQAKAMDMPELLTLGRNIGLKIGLFPIHEYWTDVGQPDDLEAADQAHAVSSEPEASQAAGE